ncbi:MAG TPA: 4-hydroxy-tetrahydrodipicolinate reductase [Rectinemataceae bacterium]|nr:4-hydroxy-tetrahydrodipicolinate reductase [Rectinemataceae bacterium]
MAIRVCLAGATGWAGSALAKGIGRSDDLKLAAAVSRSHAGRRLGEVLGGGDGAEGTGGSRGLDVSVYAGVEEALAEGCEVYFDYTSPEVAKANCLIALDHGASVVIGTSGLTEADYAEIADRASKTGKAVLAVGNFALTVVLLQKFAEMAARYIPQWEIIDYASDSKPDAPSGTTRELASRLERCGPSSLTVPLEVTQGSIEARGARLSGSQIHSIRLPGYSISAEIIFGMPDQRLSIRHDAGSGAEPYVEGALLAIRKVGGLRGLHRGLDSVMELG